MWLDPPLVAPSAFGFINLGQVGLNSREEPSNLCVFLCIFIKTSTGTSVTKIQQAEEPLPGVVCVCLENGVCVFQKCIPGGVLMRGELSPESELWLCSQRGHQRGRGGGEVGMTSFTGFFDPTKKAPDGGWGGGARPPPLPQNGEYGAGSDHPPIPYPKFHDVFLFLGHLFWGGGLPLKRMGPAWDSGTAASLPIVFPEGGSGRSSR